MPDFAADPVWKGLTLWNPWAVAVALGLKRYETRSWAVAYRGVVLIHASARWDEELRGIAAGLVGSLPPGTVHGRGPLRLLDGQPTAGHVVAIARLVSCEECLFEDSYPLLERILGDLSRGRYAWGLADVVPLARPVPWRGRQRLWGVPGRLRDDVLEAIAS